MGSSRGSLKELVREGKKEGKRVLDRIMLHYIN